MMPLIAIRINLFVCITLQIGCGQKIRSLPRPLFLGQLSGFFATSIGQKKVNGMAKKPLIKMAKDA